MNSPYRDRDGDGRRAPADTNTAEPLAFSDGYSDGDAIGIDPTDRGSSSAYYRARLEHGDRDRERAFDYGYSDGYGPRGTDGFGNTPYSAGLGSNARDGYYFDLAADDAANAVHRPGSGSGDDAALDMGGHSIYGDSFGFFRHRRRERDAL